MQIIVKGIGPLKVFVLNIFGNTFEIKEKAIGSSRVVK